MNRFDGQVAIVTGGAQGIGFGIAQRLGQEGARIVLLDIDAKRLIEAGRTLTDRQGAGTPGAAHPAAPMLLPTDVTDAAQVQAAVAAALDAHGRIDVLVNAAGITGQTNVPTDQVDPADFDRVMALNVRAMFLCIRAALPAMRKANYGRIVNIASVAGKEGNAGMLAYSTSKAAVIGLTKVVGKELAETGITCNAIAPAVVRTAMVAALPEAQVKYMTDKIPMKRTGEIAEIAALAAFAASRECSFTTGFTFDATGGRATY
jgi:3-oxoacyl-[acyl-carrier protein] reductase